MAFRKKKRNIRTRKGFTILELIVVIGIFAVVSTITVINQRGFDNSVLIDNLAYEIALSVREAQVYGISTRGFESDFNSSYGVHFDIEDDDSYILFRDTGSGSVQPVERFTLNRGGRITDVCGVEDASTECDDITAVDITFTRPNPEPVFIFYDGDDDVIAGARYSGVKIELTSQGGRVKSVDIGNTGQIVVH